MQSQGPCHRRQQLYYLCIQCQIKFRHWQSGSVFHLLFTSKESPFRPSSFSFSPLFLVSNSISLPFSLSLPPSLSLSHFGLACSSSLTHARTHTRTQIRHFVMKYPYGFLHFSAKGKVCWQSQDDNFEGCSKQIPVHSFRSAEPSIRIRDLRGPYHPQEQYTIHILFEI